MTSLYLIIIFILLWRWSKTRSLAYHFLPWLIFAVVYDSMRFYPNYLVNAIDTGHLYNLEKQFFGISAADRGELFAAATACHGSAEAIWQSATLIPSEWFAIHHAPWADLLAGCLYLCWIPVPLGFACYLYLSGQRQWMQRFSWAFLTVNLLGFIGYYIHPASPPWYIMEYGFTAIPGTPGHVAGLGHFDNLTGLPIFHALYAKNANVFAAMPSLHAAYMLVTTAYAVASKCKRYVSLTFGIICVGIWWTAVYSGHHYILDVLFGIATALIGMLLCETMRLFYLRYHS